MKQILEKQYTARYIRNGFKFRSHIKWFYFKSHVEKSNLKQESSAKDLSLSEAQVAQLLLQCSSDLEVTVPSTNLLKLIIKLIIQSHSFQSKLSTHLCCSIEKEQNISTVEGNIPSHFSLTNGSQKSAPASLHKFREQGEHTWHVCRGREGGGGEGEQADTSWGMRMPQNSTGQQTPSGLQGYEGKNSSW